MDARNTTALRKKSEEGAQLCPGTVKEHSRRIYTFHLDTALEEPWYYRDLFTILQEMD